MARGIRRTAPRSDEHCLREVGSESESKLTESSDALRPAVFLDRDGTICEEMGYLNHISRLHIFPFAARGHSPAERGRPAGDRGDQSVRHLARNFSGIAGRAGARAHHARTGGGAARAWTPITIARTSVRTIAIAASRCRACSIAPRASTGCSWTVPSWSAIAMATWSWRTRRRARRAGADRLWAGRIRTAAAGMAAAARCGRRRPGAGGGRDPRGIEMSAERRRSNRMRNAPQPVSTRPRARRRTLRA